MSETQRLPAVSTVTDCGLHKLAAEVATQVRTVKFGWPSTSEAAMPLVNGGSKRITRLLLFLATHTEPDGSTARPRGRFMVDAVIPVVCVVNPACPSTSAAASPLMKGLAGRFGSPAGG